MLKFANYVLIISYTQIPMQNTFMRKNTILNSSFDKPNFHLYRILLDCYKNKNKSKQKCLNFTNEYSHFFFFLF